MYVLPATETKVQSVYKELEVGEGSGGEWGKVKIEG